MADLVTILINCVVWCRKFVWNNKVLYIFRRNCKIYIKSHKYCCWIIAFEIKLTEHFMRSVFFFIQLLEDWLGYQMI